MKKMEQLTTFLRTVIRDKSLLSASTFKRYALSQVGFIISQTSSGRDLPSQIEDCVVRIDFGELTGDSSLKRIFTEILKANVLDPEVQEFTIEKLTEIGFDFME